jgi:hypothetical protein
VPLSRLRIKLGKAPRTQSGAAQNRTVAIKRRTLIQVMEFPTFEATHDGGGGKEINEKSRE